MSKNNLLEKIIKEVKNLDQFLNKLQMINETGLIEPLPPIYTDPSYDFDLLQYTIKDIEEKGIIIRLASLKGKEENGKSSNLHIYEIVDDKSLPFTKIFDIPGGGPAAEDEKVKEYLGTNEKLRIRSEEQVYLGNKLEKVAIVNIPPTPQS
jgi:hypothetical protein